MLSCAASLSTATATVISTRPAPGWAVSGWVASGWAVVAREERDSEV